jgi:hypothetical protein
LFLASFTAFRQALNLLTIFSSPFSLEKLGTNGLGTMDGRLRATSITCDTLSKIQAKYLPMPRHKRSPPLFQGLRRFPRHMANGRSGPPNSLTGELRKDYPKIEYHPPEIEYGLGILPKAYCKIVTRNCSQRGFILTGGFFLSYYVTKITSFIGDYG